MNAQNNIHFTQYYNAPMTLNPALTGQFDDAFRATAIMRQQWSGLSTLSTSEYLMQTKSASFEVSLLKKRLGIGLCVLNDETGSSIFNSYRGYFSLAYGHNFGDNHLSIGVQPMFNLSSLDRTKLDFGKIDESNFNDNVSYFDLNVGMNYHHDFGFFLADFGASATHLLHAALSFNLKSKPSLVFHVGVKNCLNTGYIDHLSRLKNIELQQPGRNFYLSVKYNFIK
jgi:type IX secretion system PorP/SprF family membrane protein